MSAPKFGEWLPRESAPKDGSFFLGFGRPNQSHGSAMGLVRWENTEYDGMETVKIVFAPSGEKIEEQRALVKKAHGFWAGEIQPTHWMPLPPPPETQK